MNIVQLSEKKREKKLKLNHCNCVCVHNMAHGIKKILIEKKEELECNNNQQSVKSNKMALNSLLMLDNNCCASTTNQNLLNQKNSSTNASALQASVAAATAITHPTLPPTHATLMNNSNGNKLTLNCSGASMSTITSSSTATKSPTTKMGSRRIFTPQFKLQVLESYRNDSDCKGNQRATARKYGIHRRQIQKWLQCENNLRSIIANNPQNVRNNAIKSIPKATAPILSSTMSTATSSRHRGVVGANTDKSNGATYSCFTLANVKGYKTNGSPSSMNTTTKSLVSQSSSSSSSFVAYENFASNVASANLPPQLHGNHLIINNNFYFDNSHMIFNKLEELPIDLSCTANNNNNNSIKIKSETVARPIPLHPSQALSNYKIPFYNYSPSTASSSSPHLIDISNSVIKSEKNQQHCIDPIDLSISNVSHKRKHSTDNDNKKPIKLFRPYLESNFDNEEQKQQQQQLVETSEEDEREDEEEVGNALIKQECDHAQKFPIIWSNAYNFYPDHFQSPPTASNHSFLMNTSFNNHLAITSPSSSALSSPNDSGIMNTSFNNHPTLLPPSQASPVSGYDSSTSSIYSFNDNEVDLSRGNSSPYNTSSSNYDAPSSPLSSATLSPTTTETKVPLSSFLHDLKFKLYTLDCYYNDVECKRNEKLVAHKLNINCKVVEKWLRQESDLRDQQKQYHLQILV